MVGISFGSPYLPSYKYFDAYKCGTYGYGSISLKAATDALFGRKDIEGKLPITLDNQFHQGHGIELKKDKIFNNSINQSIDLSEPIKIIDNAISKNIFPGAQIFISKGDQILLIKDLEN